jgi:excisionase family DNA binding protein
VEPVSTEGATPPLIPTPAPNGLSDRPMPPTEVSVEAESKDTAQAPAQVHAQTLLESLSPSIESTGPVQGDATEEETTAAKKRARRLTSKKAETAPPVGRETPEQLQALWDRVPRHVQALIRTQNDEVAQRSYKNFRESREELVFRLLDPELSLEEAARILAVCPTTVRRYTNRGLLPHHRTPGNQRRFRLSHVLEFMERYGYALQTEDRKVRAEGGGDESEERREGSAESGSTSPSLPS